MTDDHTADAANLTEADPDTPDKPDSESRDETSEGQDTQGRRRRDAGAEAATRRRQLRDAEAARDALAARVETYQRRDVERLAATRLAAPEDLWAVAGLTLDDLTTDTGDIDEPRVTEAIDELLAKRPGLAVPGPKYPDMAGGKRGGIDQTTTWSDFLRNAR